MSGLDRVCPRRYESSATLNDPSTPRDPDERRGRASRDASLLARAGGVALTGGALAALAGCENTTTPVAAGGGGGAARGSSATRRRAARSTRRASRSRAATTRSRCRSSATRSRARPSPRRAASCRSTTTPTTSTRRSSRSSASARASASGSRRSTRSTRRSPSSPPAACEFDVIFSTPDQLSRLVGASCIQPLNFELVPNLQKNVWPELHNPFYDVGPRYSVPYITYTTGDRLAQRQARLRPDQARPAVGRVLAGREVPRARSRSSTTTREGPGMALMRRGVTDLNTEDPDAARRRPSRTSSSLASDVRVKVSIADYETVPAGRVWLHQAWSGDMIAGVISYLPKGTSPTCSPTGTRSRAGRSSTTASCVAAKAEKPVIAHRFLNYMLDNEVGLRELRGLRRLPAAADRDRRPASSSTTGSSRRRSRRPSSPARPTRTATPT